MVTRIAEAWGFDFDKENLFPQPSVNEDIEHLKDYEDMHYQLQPQPTMHGEPYGAMPLIIRPAYEGDFLEKLRQNLVKTAADPTNLQDFSMPSEMLKHQEEPYPRELQDEFYEFNNVGDSDDYSVLREYYKRDWGDNESPEMSEDHFDKSVRPVYPKEPIQIQFRASHIVQSFLNRQPVDPQMVVARFLMETCPMPLDPLEQQIKTAKLLKDLEKSEITTKAKGTRKPDAADVSVLLARAEPHVGRWTFRTSTKNESYVTIFQFIPQGNLLDTNKLHVRVSCSCPSFLFWGAQYNAIMGDYFYGAIRPKFTKPGERDPQNSFLVCKHILACISTVTNYRVKPMGVPQKERLQAAPKLRLDKTAPQEKLHIPTELLSIGDRPNIQDITSKWDALAPIKRRQFILSLADPEEVAYLAHRFPETATLFVVEKLKSLALKSLKAADREEAGELLREII